MRNTYSHVWRTMVTLVCVAAFTSVEAAPGTGPAALAGTNEDKAKKPSVSVRTSPQTGFSPLRVVATAELRGGSSDYEDFYCPVIEWDWGDGTRSEQRVDCDPYEAGKSEVRRRYTVERTFHTSGEFRVIFRMKQNNRVVGSGQTLLRIRPGLGDRGWPDF
jgi:hypothetical protein